MQKAVQQTSEDIAAGQRSHEDRSHTVILEMPRKVRYSISGMGFYDLNRYMTPDAGRGIHPRLW